MKKILAMLLASAMVLGLAACGGKAAATEAPATEAATTAAAATAAATTVAATTAAATEAPAEEVKNWSDKETLVIPLFTPYLDKFANKGITKYSQTWMGKIILDKFNIDFELIAAPEDKNTYYMNALAAGDMPPVLTGTNMDVINAYYDAGALVCIEDYADQLPNFMASYGEELINCYRDRYPDHKMWSWGGDTPTGTVLATGYSSMVDVIVQMNLLKEYGTDKIPYDISEWLEFFKAEQAANPTAPDGTKTYAFTFNGADFPYYFFYLPQWRDGNTATSAGKYIAGFDYAKDEFYAMPVSDIVKATFKWSNDMYKAGVLDPECYTLDSATMVEKAANGYVLAYGNNANSDATVNASLESIYGNQDHSVVQMPISPNNADCRLTGLSGTGYNICLTTGMKEDDYERFFAFLDFMRSEEGLLLYGSGQEGVDYEIVNGVRNPIGKYAEEMANGYAEGYAFQQGMWESYSIATIFGGSWADYSVDKQPFRMNRMSTVATEMGCNDAQKAFYKDLGWTTYVDWWNQHLKRVDIYKVKTSVPADQPINEVLPVVQEEMIRYAAKLTFADDFEATWTEFTAAMEAAGMQKVVDYFNSTLK